MLYPSRQTHTFNLDDGHLNGQPDGRTAITPAHALGYIMYNWIFYMFERKPIAFASKI